MQRLADICDLIVRWGLVALITFTPLAFGTVEAWAIPIMQWGIVTLVLTTWAGHALRGEGGRSRLILKSGLFLPLALFLAVCVLQTVPMPRSWLGILSPGSARLYALGESASLPADAVAAAHVAEMVEHLDLRPMPEHRPISVNPEASRARIKLLVVFFGLFFLAAAWADRGERILFLLGSITIVGSAVALFGVVQHLTWNGKLYWVRRVARDGAFGPFVNHNHFAGYVEMVIPLALCMAFYLLDSDRRLPESLELKETTEGPVADGSRSGDGRELLARLWGQSTLAFFASMILIASLFLSRSRGGILSALLSSLVLFFLLWRRIGSRLLAWSIAVILPIMTLLFTLWVGADLLKHYGTALQAVEHEASLRSRWIVWGAIVRHMPLAGWTGHGIGAFEDSFAPYAPPGSASRWDKAHNDYLQLGWETGIAGGIFILWGGLVYFRRYLWPALRARAHPLDLFRLGTAVAVLSLLLHSFVDFNLQIGSNGFLFALLSGLLVALHRQVGDEESTLKVGEEESDAASSQLQRPRGGRIV